MGTYIGRISGKKVYAVETIDDLREKYPLEERCLYIVNNEGIMVEGDYIIAEINPENMTIEYIPWPEYIDLKPPKRSLTKQIRKEIIKDSEDVYVNEDIDSLLDLAMTRTEICGIKLEV
jgi:hypothetical protein